MASQGAILQTLFFLVVLFAVPVFAESAIPDDTVIVYLMLWVLVSSLCSRP